MKRKICENLLRQAGGICWSWLQLRGPVPYGHSPTARDEIKLDLNQFDLAVGFLGMIGSNLDSLPIQICGR